MFVEFQEICRNRHSIRKFTDDAITDDQVERILNIVQLAPSAGNLQAYEVIVVKSKEVKQQLSKAALGQKFIEQAPIVLVFNALTHVSSSRYSERGVKLYSIQDATIACTYAMLAATSIGLASVWVGAYDDNAVIEITKSREDALPVAILPIGYQAEIGLPNARRAVEHIAREL